MIANQAKPRRYPIGWGIFYLLYSEENGSIKFIAVLSSCFLDHMVSANLGKSGKVGEFTYPIKKVREKSGKLFLEQQIQEKLLEYK